MQVIDRSRKLWSEEADKAALRERTSFVAGDFFKSGVLYVCWSLRFMISALPASLQTCFTDGGTYLALPGCLCAALVKLAALPCVSHQCVCLMQLSTCRCALTGYRLYLVNLSCLSARSSAFYSKHITY